MPMKKRKSPARDRYERNNPVVSCRVDRELYDRLQRAKKVEGMSYTDILKAGLGLIEVKIRSEEKIRLQGYDQGYEDAANAAYKLYAVSYPCSVCGKTIIVETKEEKEAIAKYMVEHGWAHGDCLNR